MPRTKMGYLTLSLVLLSGLIAGCSDEANGEEEKEKEFPTKQITMVVPFSAGGAGDIMTREIARISEDMFGQRVIVDNKPGGSGAVAVNHILNQEADGHMIMNQTSTLPQTMASGEIPFTPEDMVPVATMVSNYQALAVKANSPFETMEDFIKYAKENPGKLNVVGANTNGANHVFALKVRDAADIDFNYVAYDGGGEAVTRLLGENGDAIATSGQNIKQQVDAGEIRMLAISDSERLPDYPDVPTFKELGLDAVDGEMIWRGFFVKPDTPDHVIAEIQDVLKQVTESEEFIEYTEKTNEEVYFLTGEELEELYKRYYDESKELFEKYK